MKERPQLAVDCVIFDDQQRVLVIRRLRGPFEGQYALPGGKVEIGETVEEACIRETLEETGLHVTNLKLVGVYSRPDRDPRGHSVSVAFLGEVESGIAKPGSDASAVEWIDAWQDVSLAFDHSHIIRDAADLLG